MGMLRELVAFCMCASLMLPGWMMPRSRPEIAWQPPEPCPAPSDSLEPFIEQLENVTVRQTWTAQVLGQVKFYREKKEDFGNKADFLTASHLMRWYDKDGRCGSKSAVVLLAGANKGHSTSNVLQACPKARMHIFEIQQRLFEVQAKRFKDSSLVTVHHKGWSDSIQMKQITLPRGDGHEAAGLYLPTGRWKNAMLLNETVETIPLADFVHQAAAPHFLHFKGVERLSKAF